jgi:hypothetical protein
MLRPLALLPLALVLALAPVLALVLVLKLAPRQLALGQQRQQRA